MKRSKQMTEIRAIIMKMLGNEQEIPALKKTRKQLMRSIIKLVWQHEGSRGQR
jgi:hypothetical protein